MINSDTFVTTWVRISNKTTAKFCTDRNGDYRKLINEMNPCAQETVSYPIDRARFGISLNYVYHRVMYTMGFQDPFT